MLCAFQIMDFPAHLRPASVLLSPPHSDKWALLDAIVAATANAWDLSPELANECHRCLLAREHSVSTGMEAGIAVPHAAVAGLPQLILGMAILPRGLEFESLDGQPATVVVMILVPKTEKLAHLQTLTEVARRLSGSAFRQSLLAAQTGEQVVGLWS
jgi:mannitol/fructose-specific phosphotransferase system IIA component (Ntr-type)